MALLPTGDGLAPGNDRRAACGEDLDDLAARMSACRICRDNPLGGEARRLPHEPRPVFVLSDKALILICGQAPGTRVHASGRPFSDPSGERLRSWLGVTGREFYDPERFAIVPMGLCFPGLDSKGGDLPPRRECVSTWHERVMAAMPQLRLVVSIGQYAQRFHLQRRWRGTLTATVSAWQDIVAENSGRIMHVPLPHPSWRNNGWLKKNPWFEAELLPFLQKTVKDCLPEVPRPS